MFNGSERVHMCRCEQKPVQERARDTELQRRPRTTTVRTTDDDCVDDCVCDCDCVDDDCVDDDCVADCEENASTHTDHRGTEGLEQPL